MAYVDGFVIAVPSTNREAFIAHARSIDSLFLEYGATRVVENWADDVPDGTLTDFRRAVQATADETVAFAWIEWPDKATRDAGFARFQQAMETDERFDPTRNQPPFDGKRMIFGGFETVFEIGAAPVLAPATGDA